MVKIGERVKKLRRSRGWTQKQLAEKAGLHRVSIGQIEAEMRTPDLKTRNKLAKAFKIKIANLLGEETMEWNVQIEKKVSLVKGNDTDVKRVSEWLSKIEEAEKGWAWNDQMSAGRAKSFLELANTYKKLAILELYNLQYANTEEKHLWQKSMDIAE